MPKHQHQKAVSSTGAADECPYRPVSNRPPSGGSRRTRRSVQPSDDEDDDEGKKKQGEKRVTRSTKPNCSIYGLDRYLRFPGYKFCSNCKFYDDAVQANQLHHSSSKYSRPYRCRSEHTSWSFPTQKIVPHFSLLIRKQDSKSREVSGL